jgi:undecaprenyl-diphosphatase
MVIDWLWNLDKTVLYFLNVTCADPILDQFWNAITHLHKIDWIRFGAFPVFLLWFFYIYRWRALKPLAAVALAVLLADSISYRVVKQLVDRQRPFNNPEVSTWVRHVGEAHGPSFPSNHAANCFAVAGVLAWYFRKSRHYFYSFAALVAISRPALGVHFPSDVLAGAILGIFVAALIRILLLRRFSWFQLYPTALNE